MPRRGEHERRLPVGGERLDLARYAERVEEQPLAVVDRVGRHALVPARSTASPGAVPASAESPTQLAHGTMLLNACAFPMPANRGRRGNRPAPGPRNSGSTVGSLAVLRVGSIVLRVDDLQRQTRFWEAALGYVRRDKGRERRLRPARPGRRSRAQPFPRSGSLGLQIPPRLHLDLYTEDQAREVERLLALGATEVHWDKRPPDADYVILADPEGNRFCVVDITL